MVTSSRGDDLAEPLRDFAAVRGEVMRALMGRILFVRLLLVPLLLSVVVFAVWLDPDPWRVAVAAVLFVAMVGLFGVEYWRFERGWSSAAALPPNLVGMLWIQLGVVVLTGGIEGPLFPILPVAAMQMATILGPGPHLAAVVGAQLVGVWVMAALVATGHSLAVQPLSTLANWPVLLASALTVMLVAAVGIGSKVRSIVAELVNASLSAHDSERVAHADHAREMVALTGEIAHELKNPLASIKGLAALLARDVSLDSKAAERLKVLRAEVERMHETLDQFLDLSRPLVPLTQTDVALNELGTEVAALCDGIARTRGVALVAEEGAVVARADRRKLRQVLVNLVQNAIEAAPSGTEVRVSAAEVATGLVLCVSDRGAGVPDELREAAFAPGVTTRPRGSGLGLTIARALVQQHGGTLSLDPRDGGGTVARVLLPRPPAKDGP